jgi:hypothetical protein
VAQRKRQPQSGRYADRWLLDPEVVFLNHGSFGATPKAVVEEQTRIQWRIEALLVSLTIRKAMSLEVDVQEAEFNHLQIGLLDRAPRMRLDLINNQGGVR